MDEVGAWDVGVLGGVAELAEHVSALGDGVGLVVGDVEADVEGGECAFAAEGRGVFGDGVAEVVFVDAVEVLRPAVLGVGDELFDFGEGREVCVGVAGCVVVAFEDRDPDEVCGGDVCGGGDE